MKNIYLRLAVIGGVVALGATAIGQSMMASKTPDEPTPQPIQQAGTSDNATAQPSISSFPDSKMVLASAEAPVGASASTEAAPTQPTAPPPRPSGYSGYSSSYGATSNPAASSDNPAASGNDDDTSPSGSKVQQYLSRGGSTEDSQAASNPAAASAQDTPAPPSTSSFGSRYGVSGGSSYGAQDNASASPPSGTPPKPQSFATDGAGTRSAETGNPAAPPTRVQLGDTAAVAEEAAAVVSGAASRFAAQAEGAVEDASSAVEGAVEGASSRFSGMVNSAAQSISDQANSAAEAAEQAMPQPIPTQPSYGSSYGSSYATGDASDTTPPNPTRFSAPPSPSSASASSAGSSYGSAAPPSPSPAQPEAMQSSPAQPSVIGSAESTPYNSTRGFSDSQMPSRESYSAQPNSQPATTSQPAATQYSEPPAIAARSASMSAASVALVSDRPGESRWEGDQTPSIRLEKIAPPEVQVGRVTTFELHVENISGVEASDVTVHDMVPAGAQLDSTTPKAEKDQDGRLVWHLGTLKPKERKTIKLQIVPLEEGNIGSVASVSFAAKASVKSIVTRPQLTISQASSAKVLAGNQLGISITINNPGTGAATGVVLEENVPEIFSHPAGKELEFEVGTLKPGESRTLDLVLNATAAGQVQNLLYARADGNLEAKHALALEVIAPKLQVAMTGPTKRYLDMPAKYTVSVSNPGTAPAHNIDLVTYLPTGMKFMEANNAGQYDATRRAVFWSLAELPPNDAGSVELVVLPIEAGDHRLHVEGSAAKGLTAKAESTVQVEGLAALAFEVSDLADPIEVGKETTYEIKIDNQGSKEATNVNVVAALPPGMQPLSADGDVSGEVQGDKVFFQPISKIDPKQSVKLKVQVRGTAAGNHKISVQVTTNEIQTPITNQESTTVYSDH
ncbi:DUF11 domain-containing protein [Blastopirellula marina]|nr:DUF11 domain-containing protein [Blastopirellula marina]